jgi:hypothetical protein
MQSSQTTAAPVGAPVGVPVRPATRWIVPPPFIDHGHADGAASPHPRPHDVPCLRGALQAMLIADLRRGHDHIALRHFLMLTLAGGHVPAGIAHRCELLMLACPPKRRRRIARDARLWADMVLPQAHDDRNRRAG